MGKRSGMPETKEEGAKLTIQQLNAEIARCLYWSEHGGTSQGRKAFRSACLVREDARTDTWHSGTRS